MEDRRYTVYMHRNKLNGKVYIGITGNDPHKRWNAGLGYISNKRFSADIRKHGWDQFDHYILISGISMEAAQKKEADLIRYYNSTDSRCGYNCSTGGRGGRSGVSPSPELIEKLRRINTGKRVSEETKEKIRIARAKQQSSGMKGRHHTELTRKHLSEVGKTKVGSLNSFYGKRHSDEAKQKMRAAKAGKALTPEHVQKISDALSRPVNQYDLSGNFVRRYKSTVEASLELTGIKFSHIPDVCAGKRKTTLGFVWRYAEVI